MDKQNETVAQTTASGGNRQNQTDQSKTANGTGGADDTRHPHEQVTQRIDGAINLDLAASGIVSNSNVFTQRDRNDRLMQPDSDFGGRTCLAVNEAGGVSLVVLELEPDQPLPKEIWTVSNGVWSRIHHLIEWSAFRQLVYQCGRAVTAAGIHWTPVSALAVATIACAHATDWPWPPEHHEDFNVNRFHETVMQLAPLCPASPFMDRTWSYDDAGKRQGDQLVSDDAGQREGAAGETQKGERAA